MNRLLNLFILLRSVLTTCVVIAEHVRARKRCRRFWTFKLKAHGVSTGTSHTVNVLTTYVARRTNDHGVLKKKTFGGSACFSRGRTGHASYTYGL